MRQGKEKQCENNNLQANFVFLAVVVEEVHYVTTNDEIIEKNSPYSDCRDVTDD